MSTPSVRSAIKSTLAPMALFLLCGCTSSQPTASNEQTVPTPVIPASTQNEPAWATFTGTDLAAVTPTAPTPAAEYTNIYPFSRFEGAPDTATPDPEPMGVGPVRRVSFSQVGSDFDPVMTPDGKRLVFASTQHRKTADIYVKEVDGVVVTQLTADPADDVMPAVSPDGTKIAFASNRGGNWDIFVAPITGGQAIRVTGDPADELHPTWSPDGKRIAFCRMGEASGRWEMWVTSIEAGVANQFIGYGMFPRWCPVAGTGFAGSDRILFQVGRERGTRAFGVWTIDYKDGHAGNATELVSNPTAALINPSWSSDGRRIVYSEVPLEATVNAATPPRMARLWMQNIDGTNKVRLTEGAAVALMPFWAPGDQVVFMSPRGGLENIWSIDVHETVAMLDGQNPANTPATITTVAVPEAPPEVGDQTDGNR